MAAARATRMAAGPTGGWVGQRILIGRAFSEQDRDRRCAKLLPRAVEREPHLSRGHSSRRAARFASEGSGHRLLLRSARQ